MVLNPGKLLTMVAFVGGIMCLSEDAFAQKKGRKKKSMPTPTQVMQGNLVHHVNVLAHDSLEGRRTGTEGERKAVNYIANQYIALGIGGAAKDGDYKQVFEIDEGRRFEKSSSFSIDGKPLKPGEDYFPFQWSAEGIIETTSSVSLNESGDAWWVDIDPVIEKNRENPHFLLATHLQEVAKDAAGNMTCHSNGSKVEYRVNGDRVYTDRNSTTIYKADKTRFTLYNGCTKWLKESPTGKKTEVDSPDPLDVPQVAFEGVSVRSG